MEIRTGLAPFRHAPFGLARRPLRPAEPAEDASGAAEAPPPADPAPASEAASAAYERTSPEPAPAPVLPGLAPPPRRKRRLMGATAETLPVRRKLADGLGLVRRCDAKACRRAKRCLGVRGAACLPDRPELDEALRAIRQAYERMRE